MVLMFHVKRRPRRTEPAGRSSEAPLHIWRFWRPDLPPPFFWRPRLRGQLPAARAGGPAPGTFTSFVRPTYRHLAFRVARLYPHLQMSPGEERELGFALPLLAGSLVARRGRG